MKHFKSCQGQRHGVAAMVWAWEASMCCSVLNRRIYRKIYLDLDLSQSRIEFHQNDNKPFGYSCQTSRTLFMTVLRCGSSAPYTRVAGSYVHHQL